jgi:hypothetical protein
VAAAFSRRVEQGVMFATFPEFLGSRIAVSFCLFSSANSGGVISYCPHLGTAPTRAAGEAQLWSEASKVKAFAELRSGTQSATLLRVQDRAQMGHGSSP